MTKLDRNSDNDGAPALELTITLNRAALARAFYCDVLRGREMWNAAHLDGDDKLSFLVEETRFEVSMTGSASATPIVLIVDKPEELAERCWDAGFTVRVHQDAGGRLPISVTDPFGRRIDLVARRATLSVGASA
jgi:hypothetical protein